MNIELYIKSFREELSLRNYADNTIKNYGSTIALFLSEHNTKQSPKEINEVEIKKYLLNIKWIQTRYNTVNAIRTYYRIMFNQNVKADNIPFPRREYHLPKVIEHEELISKINSIVNKKHMAIICLAYGCSLRVSEVVNLKMKNIRRKENIIFIEQAKGFKDRIVKVSDFVLQALTDYYNDCYHKPVNYLFEGWSGGKYSVRSCQQIFKKYIAKDQSFHSLRRSGITEMINNGIDSIIVKTISGHSSVKTLDRYFHVSNRTISKVQTAI